MNYIVIEAHPNSGRMWVGFVGSKMALEDYLYGMNYECNLDYIFAIFPLEPGECPVTEDFLDFKDGEPSLKGVGDET